MAPTFCHILKLPRSGALSLVSVIYFLPVSYLYKIKIHQTIRKFRSRFVFGQMGDNEIRTASVYAVKAVSLEPSHCAYQCHLIKQKEACLPHISERLCVAVHFYH